MTTVNGHLDAARMLQSRVSLADIVRQKTPFGFAIQDAADPAWWDELFSDANVPDSEDMEDESQDGMDHTGRHKVAELARPLWELECLVSALDCLETTACVALGHRQ